jgi:ubiquinone/menaquinone biosynthesis C-methylase UbiE
MTLFYLTLAKICHTIPALRRPFWKYVYERLAKSYELQEWTFMNYGYLSENAEPSLELSPDDENDRNLIALYHHIANAGELRGKRVLEVGCGRGGGSSYVTRYLQPSQMVSIDISDNAVEFCKNRHPIDGLEFRQGDAESLPFEDNTFDAVLNVESSHCYGSVGMFFSEVYRVLNPGGSFLYADFRPTEDVNGISEGLAEAGFVIRENEDITQNVLAALKQDSAAKQKWISDLAENHIQPTLQIFAATSGTKLYKEFQQGALHYFRFHAEKP